MNKKRILFVWDFHGVLEKDNELAVLDVTNRVIEEFGYSTCASLEDILSMYGLKWGEYYRLLISEIDEGTVERMVERSVELGRPSAIEHVKPQDHALRVLVRISEAGHRNVVLSNTAQKDLEFFLDLVCITRYVDEFFGVGDMKDRSKADVMKDLTSQDEYLKVILISDTENDIEVGLRFNATTYLFKSREKLGDTKAHFIITDLREVLNEI